jgi:hypothetical protein
LDDAAFDLIDAAVRVDDLARVQGGHTRVTRTRPFFPSTSTSAASR